MFLGLKDQMRQYVDVEKERINSLIKTTSTVDPEFIMWENNGQTKRSRNFRKLLSIVIFLGIILLSSYLTVVFNSYKEEVMGKSI